MAPLSVLIVVFLIMIGWTYVRCGEANWPRSGRIGLSVMLVFTAIGHFIYREGMTMMLPEWMPMKLIVVYVTGLIEIGLAIAILMPRTRKIAAYLLIAFLILVLPANIIAAIKQVDYKQANLEGNGADYLLFRVPLQLFFMAWTYTWGIHFSRQSEKS